MNNLKQIREFRGMGVNELSRVSGVNAGYISSLENGKRTNPSMETLGKLAEALGVSVDKIITKENVELRHTVKIYEDLNVNKSNCINLPIIELKSYNKDYLNISNMVGCYPTTIDVVYNTTYDYFYISSNNLKSNYPTDTLLLVQERKDFNTMDLVVAHISKIGFAICKYININGQIGLILQNQMSNCTIYCNNFELIGKIIQEVVCY